MSGQPSYLYGIVQAEGPKDFGVIGLGGGLVRTVCEGGIGIVAGESERLAFSRIAPEKTLQCLAQHQRVLEQVMRDSPVIPLKFGTYADDEGQIRRILRQGAREFAAALKEFGTKVEVDLSACWTDLAGVLAEIAGDAAIAAAKARLADRPASTQQRAEVGQLVKKLLDERRDQVAVRLEAALRAVCAKVIVNPAKDDTTILNAAVLIGRTEQARLEGVLDQLDHSHAGRLHIRCIGPLPAYSFAMAEIQALDADELDAARQALQLGETASLAQIKAAYRRLLAELHPDRVPRGDGIRRGEGVPPSRTEGEPYGPVRVLPPASSSSSDVSSPYRRTKGKEETEETTRGRDALETRGQDALATSRLQDVSDAYRILEEYALNFRHALGSGEGAVIVKVRSLDDLRAASRPPARTARATSLQCAEVEAA